jgi:nickel transport protein
LKCVSLRKKNGRGWSHHRTLLVASFGGFLNVFSAYAVDAHALGVFVTLNCTSVDVEARYSNGEPARSGTIAIYDDKDDLMTETAVRPGEATRVPFETADAASGFRVVVDTGSHEDYWIVTPEDVTSSCAQSSK